MKVGGDDGGGGEAGRLRKGRERGAYQGDGRRDTVECVDRQGEVKCKRCTLGYCKVAAQFVSAWNVRGLEL